MCTSMMEGLYFFSVLSCGSLYAGAPQPMPPGVGEGYPAAYHPYIPQEILWDSDPKKERE